MMPENVTARIDHTRKTRPLKQQRAIPWMVHLLLSASVWELITFKTMISDVPVIFETSEFTLPMSTELFGWWRDTGGSLNQLVGNDFYVHKKPKVTSEAPASGTLLLWICTLTEPSKWYQKDSAFEMLVFRLPRHPSDTWNKQFEKGNRSGTTCVCRSPERPSRLVVPSWMTRRRRIATYSCMKKHLSECLIYYPSIWLGPHCFEITSRLIAYA